MISHGNFPTRSPSGRLAASPKPPVHLPLGNDTLKYYREKTEAFEKEIAEWHDVITSTDNDDVAAH